MQARALGNALAIALISVLLMLGALSISLVEYAPEKAATATDLVLPSIPPVIITSPQPTLTEAPTSLIPLDTPTETPSATPTVTATAPNTCPIPPGWGQVIVQPYDTLDKIAARYRMSTAQLRDINCLPGNTLVSGSVLYVPPVTTNTPALCIEGKAGWTKNYIVKSGDTLYSIAKRYGVTDSQMKDVNCHPTDSIYPGNILWVPIVSATFTPPPTLTPIPGDTAIPYPTDPLTETPLPYTATIVPSPTLAPNTPTPIPTVTASPTEFPK